MALRTISLFSGVGMLDEGVSAACRYLGREYRTVCFVEREAYAAAVLVARMEDASLGQAPVWDSLETFDGRAWRGAVDLVTASPPCQPYSSAGRQQGNLDSRSFGDGQGPLWHTLRIIDECRPALVFFENVPQWVTAGHFRAFGDSLSALGYEIEDPVFLTAKAVGASHKRERVFILAHREGVGTLRRTAGQGSDVEQRDGGMGDTKRDGGRFDQQGRGPEGRDAASGAGEGLADAECAEPRAGIEGEQSEPTELRRDRPANDGGELADAQRPRPQGERSGESQRGSEPVALRGDGGAYPLFAPGPGDFDGWGRVVADGSYDYRAPAIEPGVRVLADGISLVVDASRADQLRCSGNAVVPLCAAVAFVELVRGSLT